MGLARSRGGHSAPSRLGLCPHPRALPRYLPGPLARRQGWLLSFAGFARPHPRISADSRRRLRGDGARLVFDAPRSPGRIDRLEEVRAAPLHPGNACTAPPLIDCSRSTKPRSPLPRDLNPRALRSSPNAAFRNTRPKPATNTHAAQRMGWIPIRSRRKPIASVAGNRTTTRPSVAAVRLPAGTSVQVARSAED